MGDGDEVADADGLTLRQHRAVVALLSSPTTRDAARKAKVAEATLYGWLRQPAFARAVRAARREMTQQALTALGHLAKDAIGALKRNLRCDQPAVEVRAALGVLDKAINGQALADLQAEVEELRAELGRTHADRGHAVAGADQTPGGDRPPAGAARPDARPAAGGPDAPVPGDGLAGGPVAGGVPLFDE